MLWVNRISSPAAWAAMYSLYAARCVRCAARWVNPWRCSSSASQPLALTTWRRRQVRRAPRWVKPSRRSMTRRLAHFSYCVVGQPLAWRRLLGAAILGQLFLPARHALLSSDDFFFAPVTRRYFGATLASRPSCAARLFLAPLHSQCHPLFTLPLDVALAHSTKARES
jgi:hypothetical protein